MEERRVEEVFNLLKKMKLLRCPLSRSTQESVEETIRLLSDDIKNYVDDPANFKAILIQTLEDIHPSTPIQDEALDFLEKKLLEMKHAFTSAETKITNIVSQFPKGLRDHAMSEIKRFVSKNKIDTVVIYLSTEILELSGNMTHGDEIQIEHIKDAIWKDEELKELFQKMKISL